MTRFDKIRSLNFLCYFVISLVSISLRSAVKVTAMYLPHDDLHYLRQAYHLANFEWLGDYDELTLATGMFYPLFMAGSFMAGWPLKIAEQTVYLGAAGLSAWLVIRVTNNKLAGLLTFTLLAFNPILWHPDLARVIREGLYVSLSLAVLMLAGLALLPRNPESSSSRTPLAILIAFGLMAGALWLTREEGLWLAPAILVLVVAAGVQNWSRWRTAYREGGSVSAWLPVLRGGAVAIGVFVLVVGTVATVNFVQYGVFVTNEFHSAPFRAAYGALSRIRPDHWAPYVIVSKDAREKAYAVSPAARELQATLDGPVGEQWRNMGCQALGTEPCKEIISALFMWAFRDAVARAGHYRTGRETFAYYRRLANEINQACEQNLIPCIARRATMAPPFRTQFVRDFLTHVPRVIGPLLHMGGGVVGAEPSRTTEEVIALFANLVGPVAARTQAKWELVGWAAAPSALPQITIRDQSGTPFFAQMDMMDGPDVESALPGQRARRFVVVTDCTRPSCEIVVGAGSTGARAFRIYDINQGAALASPDLSVFLDRKGTITPNTNRLRDLQLRIASAIAQYYARAMPTLSVLALAGLLLATVMIAFQPVSSGAVALALACATALASRVVLLAYIDATSFNAVRFRYISPASPFLIVFVVLGLYLGGKVLVALARKIRSARRAEV